MRTEVRSIMVARTCEGPADHPDAPARDGGTHAGPEPFPCSAELLMVTLLLPACGCRITGDGTIQHPLRIVPCDDHAPTMYAPRVSITPAARTVRL